MFLSLSNFFLIIMSSVQGALYSNEYSPFHEKILKPSKENPAHEGCADKPSGRHRALGALAELPTKFNKCQHDERHSSHG